MRSGPGRRARWSWSWLRQAAQPPLAQGPAPTERLCLQLRGGTRGLGPPPPALPTAPCPAARSTQGSLSAHVPGARALRPRVGGGPGVPLVPLCSRPVPPLRLVILRQPARQPLPHRWHGVFPPGPFRLLRGGGASGTDGADREAHKRGCRGFCGVHRSSPVEQGSCRNWGGRQKRDRGETWGVGGCRELEAGDPGCGQLCVFRAGPGSCGDSALGLGSGEAAAGAQSAQGRPHPAASRSAPPG